MSAAAAAAAAAAAPVTHPRIPAQSDAVSPHWYVPVKHVIKPLTKRYNHLSETLNP